MCDDKIENFAKFTFELMHPTCVVLLVYYIFVIVNSDALEQASDIWI